MGAGGVGRPSPGPGPSPSSSPGPGSKPLPWKSTYVEDPISRVPHTNPSQNSIALACSPSGARIATRPGSTIAMRTPANRSQNLDRRLSGQANTTQLSAPLRMASNESTNTTFMPQSYHPRRRRREHAWRDSLCEDSTLWTDRCLGFERQRARSLPRSGDLPCRHRNGDDSSTRRNHDRRERRRLDCTAGGVGADRRALFAPARSWSVVTRRHR